MGNCFKRSSTDDISLLRGGNEPNRESTEQLGPAPLYSVIVVMIPSCFYHFPYRTSNIFDEFHIFDIQFHLISNEFHLSLCCPCRRFCSRYFIRHHR